MTKSKTTSSSKITACPECDSGNLHFEGSSVECISCGWKHTAAKPQRTSPKAKPEPEKAIADLNSVAAQLTAAVQKAPAAKAKGERTRQVPTTVLVVAKDFKPRTNQLGTEGDAGRWAQAANWVTVVDFLKEHDGKATYEQLVTAILDRAKANGYEKTCNARGFVQGRVRGGHLAAAK